MVRPLPNPPEEEKGPREVSPVTFLTQRDVQTTPPGVVHPSKSITHNFTMNDQDVEHDEDEALPTPEDRNEPLLAEVDPNALKGAATGS